MAPIEPDEVTSLQAAELLGISKQRINSYITRGLKGHVLQARAVPFRTGTNRFLIRRADLDEFVTATGLELRNRQRSEPTPVAVAEVVQDPSGGRYSIDTLERVMELQRQHQIELELAGAHHRIETLEKENETLRTAVRAYAQLLTTLGEANLGVPN